MQSLSSSNFFFGGPGSPLFSSKPRDKDILFISVIHLRGDFLKRSNFFIDETKKLVWTFLRLETRSSIQYFWSFTMHSISSSRFLLRPWCNCTLFYPKRARYSVHLNDSSKGGFFEKKQFFHRWDQKSGFNLSMLRNTFQRSILLKFHHALIIFIEFLFAAPVHFYSVLL